MIFPKCVKALVIFMLGVSLSNAQQIHLQGSVTDAQTGQPVSAATVSITAKRLFFPADSSGKFNIINRNLVKSDSVAFSCIGYQTFKMLIGDITDNVIIKLSPQVNMLGEVKIGNAGPVYISVGSKVKSSKLPVSQ